MADKIIGYIPGVFDMFHIGHLRIIQRAKAECDYLIIAVSTDELVMERKHKRPVIPYADRVEIVRAIRYVDAVVPQVNMNKLEAYLTHGFHKIFAGDDWQGTAEWQGFAEQFKPYGVQIVYFPRTEGISSTMLMDRYYRDDSEI